LPVFFSKTRISFGAKNAILVFPLPETGKTICTFKFGSLTVGPEGEVGAMEYCAKALKLEIENGKKDLLKLLNCVIVNDADDNNINEKKVKQDLMKNLFDFKINLNTCFTTY
jgi:hypothetical protein